MLVASGIRSAVQIGGRIIARVKKNNASWTFALSYLRNLERYVRRAVGDASLCVGQIITVGLRYGTV